jgi:hypothetical protein
MPLLNSIYDVILDRSPEEVLGAIGIAVALSIAISGFFALLRGKVGDRVLLVVVLLILASVASMGLGAGYIAYAKGHSRKADFSRGEGPPPGMGRFGPRMALASRIMGLADADGNGRLSPEEASEAAALFVVEADTTRDGSIDVASLEGAIGRRGGPPFFPFDGDGRGGRGPGRFDRPAPDGDAPFAASDKDNDGRLSPEEAADFLKPADEDRDGSISPSELAGFLRRPAGPPHSPPAEGPPQPISPRAN